MDGRCTLIVGALLLGSLPVRAQQPAESQSCSGVMTEQLRRFNEQCLSDLVSFIASHPKATARILGEKSKFYVELTRTPNGLEGEAVSRANFPFMAEATAYKLKELGWSPPPDNEEGNFRKRYATDGVPRTAEDLAKTLAAYGLNPGEAMSLTVARQD
jgi:hypothetical protein